MKELFDYLASKPYPGRGVLIGCGEDSRAVFAYFIMGRSANSRNRVFEREGNELTIYPADASKLEDPSLIIYHPVRETADAVIVTNGDQTDTVCDAVQSGGSFEKALMTRTFEPDAPNFTPRVSGIIEFGNGGFTYALSILKAGDAKGSVCKRQFFRYEPKPGVAHIIHTYEGGGAPLPSFAGEPVEVGFTDVLNCAANGMWNALDADNRVALYARSIDPAERTHSDILINRFVREASK